MIRYVRDYVTHFEYGKLVYKDGNWYLHTSRVHTQLDIDESLLPSGADPLIIALDILGRERWELVGQVSCPKDIKEYALKKSRYYRNDNNDY